MKYLKKTTPKIALFTLIAVTGLNQSYGQAFINKVNNALKGGRNIVENVGQLSKSFARTTQEFNNTVKVVKGNDEQKIKALPKEELSPLKIKKGKVQNLEWTPFISLDNQLFPSSIITLSGYKGPTTAELESIIRPIGIQFKSSNVNIPIKWEIECADKRLFDKIGGYCLYSYSNQLVLNNPEIPWNIEALAKQDASTPVNFIFRIYDDENNKAEKSVSAYLRSVDDCIRYYNDTKLLFLYTAYIQEEHPEIRKILKEATDTKIVSSITGYGGNVDYQVAAIWRVLHDRGINYSTITTTAGGNDKSQIYSQVVRTFDKSINDRQANCVDGTVVLASILRKMGIHSVMVLVPGHCFLGYYRKKDDPNGNRQDITFLETTMMDASDMIDAAKEKARKEKNQAKVQQIINQGYLDQFAVAKAVARKEYYEEFKDRVIAEIDVDMERNRITKPIPFYTANP